MGKGSKHKPFAQWREERIAAIKAGTVKNTPPPPVQGGHHQLKPFKAYKEAAWTIDRGEALRILARKIDSGKLIDYQCLADEWGIARSYLYALVHRIRVGEIKVPVEHTECECDPEGPGMACWLRQQWHGFGRGKLK